MGGDSPRAQQAACSGLRVKHGDGHGYTAARAFNYRIDQGERRDRIDGKIAERRAVQKLALRARSSCVFS
jgi:hypothetical protein